MNVKNITFGRKIPLMKASVIDKMNGKKVPVTLSEYDCRNYADDVRMFMNSCNSMDYARSIAGGMWDKHCNSDLPYNFYVLEDENNKALCICETFSCINNIYIDFIESGHDDKHKYAGQTMIAMLGKMILNQKKNNLLVSFPVLSAMDFYIKKCGFKPLQSKSLYNQLTLIMENPKIPEFINKVQKKTGSEIIDLNA